MTYSVVVVTWECADRLGALVSSMNRHLTGNAELIVVDNASSDDPASAARDWKGTTQFIPQRRNTGFGAASNVGVQAARHEGVVLLNPDTVLVDGSLEALVELALARRGLVGPRLLNPDGSKQPSASGPPVGPWPWLGAVVPGAVQPWPLRARTEPWRLERTTPVTWLTGACVAGERDALRSLGPFDPAIHMYAEDMDLGLRAAAGGVRSWFCPDVCRVVHRGAGSSAARYAGAGEHEAARNRRAVIRRRYGARAERYSWLAQRVNLRLRVIAKRALGRDAARDHAALGATRAARHVPPLEGVRAGAR